MAQSVRQVWWDDFNGGVNDLKQVDRLSPSEYLTIKNMLPSDNGGEGVSARGAVRRTNIQMAQTGETMVELFYAPLTNGEDRFLAAVSDGTNVVIRQYYQGEVIDIDGYTQTAGNASRFSFVKWSDNKVIFSDNYSGLYLIDIDSDLTDSETALQSTCSITSGDSHVIELESVAYGVSSNDITLEFVAGSSYETLVSQTGNAVTISLAGYMDVDTFVITATWGEVKNFMQGSGISYPTQTLFDFVSVTPSVNLWDTMPDVTLDTVYHFTGGVDAGQVLATSKLLNKNHAEATPDSDAPFGHSLVMHRNRLWLIQGEDIHFCGTDVTSTYAQYENWQTFDSVDPDETVIDDGNSMQVYPYGAEAIALAGAITGLYVFKDNSISIWNYPDAAAPWEVDQGTSIELVTSGITCINSDCVGQYRGRTFFIGKDSMDKKNLFSISGAEISEHGKEIPRRLSLLNESGLSIKIVGDYLMVLSDYMASLAFKLNSGAWYDLEFPSTAVV